MVFESVDALIQMNGYGPYVWSSYFAVLVVFVFLIVQSVISRRRVVLQLRAMLQREAARSRQNADVENSSSEPSD